MNILLLVDRHYPTDHAFLENIYSQLLPSTGIHCFWVMRSQVNKKFCEVKKWNKSIVFSFALPRKKNLISTWVFNVKIILIVKILLTRIKPDVVQVRNWIWGYFIAYFVKLLKRTPIVFQHSFPREILLSNRIKSGNLKTKIRAFFEKTWLRIFLKKANLIFAISQTMKEELVKKGFRENKLIPVGLAFDKESDMDNVDSSEIMKKYNLNNQSAAIYFGVMDTNRSLEFLIDIWADVKKNVPDGVLFMVGGELEDIDRLKKYSERLKLNDSIIFKGKIRRKDIPIYIKSCLITISPIPPTPLYNVSSVTKVYESLGLGCPVVGNDLPEQGQVLRESKGGICVQYEKKQFTNAIIYLFKNPEIARNMGKSGRKYILKNKTYDKIADELTQIYGKLMKA